MKCKIMLVESWSEWNPECQQCRYFRDCMNEAEKLSNSINNCCANCKFYNQNNNYCQMWYDDIEDITGFTNANVAWCDKFEQKENDMSYNSDKTYGENFPMEINRERSQMIEKLIIAELGRITRDDIIDFIIDVELYNKACKEPKKRKKSI